VYETGSLSGKIASLEQAHMGLAPSGIEHRSVWSIRMTGNQAAV